MDLVPQLCVQLRERRRELGLTLAQLARRADTSAATLSRYENGWPRFEVYTLRKLATALGCELEVRLVPRRRQAARLKRSDLVDRLGRLFWDVPLTERHFEENTLWVVERVLEYGTLEDLHGLIADLGRDRFLELVAAARLVSARTRTFWEEMLAKEGTECTRRYSRPEAETSWRGSGR